METEDVLSATESEAAIPARTQAVNDFSLCTGFLMF